MDQINNKWESDDEEEYENYYENETEPLDVDNNFKDNLLKVKHSLYDNIVLAPELGTSKAQSNEVLQEYLNRLNDVYILSINAQNGQNISQEKLNIFPENSRHAIKSSLDWIVDYFRKNRIPDTIPYSDYIRKSFHDYQFVQKDYFDE
jgi:hypothetical protein